MTQGAVGGVRMVAPDPDILSIAIGSDSIVRDADSTFLVPFRAVDPLLGRGWSLAPPEATDKAPNGDDAVASDAPVAPDASRVSDADQMDVIKEGEEAAALARASKIEALIAEGWDPKEAAEIVDAPPTGS